MEEIRKHKTIIFYIITALILFLGFLIRTHHFLAKTVFEDDECRLILTLLDAKSYWKLFLPLGDAQSAPPFFVLFSKILADILGYSERVLHFIPYAASIASLFLFYKLGSEYFKKKSSVLISLYLFAVNYSCISFAATFKQYSTDIFAAILCLYIFKKVNIAELNLKKLVLLTAFLIVLLFSSLTSAFFIAAFVGVNLINNYKNKTFYKKLVFMLIPFIITAGLYYVYNLAPSKIDMDEVFPNYWANGFCGFSISEVLRIFVANLKYAFFPNKLTVFPLILLLGGFVCCIQDKDYSRNLSYLLVLTISAAFTASLLHLYPMVLRVGLYLVPLYILTIVKSFDRVKYTKPVFWAIVLCIASSFYKYSPQYLCSFKDDSVLVGYSPKVLMLELKNRFDKKDDIILTNNASITSFLFYSAKYKFYTDRVYEMSFDSSAKEDVEKYLEGLEKNRRYWFYLIKDYKQAQIFPYIDDYLKNKKIIYKKKDRLSSLIYFEN